MRRLAMAALGFSGAVFLVYYLLPVGWAAWLAGVFAALGFGSLAFKGDGFLRVRLICFGAAVGLAVCALSYVQRTAPAQELDGVTASFEAEVVEFPQDGKYCTYVTVRLRDDSMPKVKATLYFYDTDPPEIEPGDRLSVTGNLKYSGVRYGQDWTGRTSDGVYLLCYPKQAEVTGRSSFAFRYFPLYMERAVRASVLKVCSEKTAPFVTALLTGNKQLLYDDTETHIAMSRAGILHVVAVSGMHVSFLVGFLRLLIRKKKVVSAVGIPVLWVFAALAGFTPSVVRAAFMYSAVLLAPLVDRESDSITSLSAILAILLFINPASCTSVSLQLSFSAVAGMLLLTPRIYAGLTAPFNRKRKGRRLEEGRIVRAAYGALYAVFASVSATIGAIAFSTPLTVIYFGALATYGLLANILVFWAVSACFVLGYAAAFAGMIFPPLGRLLGFVVDLLSEYVIWAAKLTGSLPYSQLHAGKGYFLFWLVAVYVVFIGWYLLRRGRSFRPVVPVCFSLSLLLVGVIGLEIGVRRAPAAFTAVDVGQGQSLVLSEKGRAIVVDCGGKGTFDNAGDTVAALLSGRGIDSVEALCLTHFDDDHINGVVRLMYQLNVKRLVIPPETEDDTGRGEILEAAEKRNVGVYIINEDTVFETGGLRLTAYRPVSRRSPELVYCAQGGGRSILITGDADMEAEQRLMLARELPDMDIFVAGHHGSAYSSGEALLEAIDAETAVISCGWNSYGHPSQAALERFAAAGMEILRTDELGTIDIVLEH